MISAAYVKEKLLKQRKFTNSKLTDKVIAHIDVVVAEVNSELNKRLKVEDLLDFWEALDAKISRDPPNRIAGYYNDKRNQLDAERNRYMRWHVGVSCWALLQSQRLTLKELAEHPLGLFPPRLKQQ